MFGKLSATLRSVRSFPRHETHRALSPFCCLLSALNTGRSLQLISALFMSCFIVCVPSVRWRPIFLLPPAGDLAAHSGNAWLSHPFGTVDFQAAFSSNFTGTSFPVTSSRTCWRRRQTILTCRDSLKVASFLVTSS